MNINGETKIIGFFGSTYKHSKLYEVYNAAIQHLGLNYLYIPFVVDNLEKAIEGIRHLGIAGLGVTIPYKVDIIPYLDELDKDAKRVGAVNVIINKNGKLIGGNTDGEGAVMALQEKIDIKGKKVVLLGTGGSARSIAFSVQDAGGDIVIINRTISYAKELAQKVGCAFASLDSLEQEIQKADILIHATPVGMVDTKTEGTSLIPSHFLHSDLLVLELVHNPQETKLIQDAKEKGCHIVYGNRMLLFQSIRKFAMFTGAEPPIKVMEEAMQKNYEKYT